MVLVQDYPNNFGGVNLKYVHTRCKYYVLHNIDVTVLNFKARENYTYDGISVITLKEYREQKDKYDLLIIHAANVRNHFRFLKIYGKRFPRFLFFYHGHEIMKINKEYSDPYFYMKKGTVKRVGQDLYDIFKLKVWKRYLPQIIHKSDFVFVSKWMLDVFMTNIELPYKLLKDKIYIIYNSVGCDFESQSYKEGGVKEYDFITIRPNLDGSKYAIDIVNRLAENSPLCKFLIVGKGKFFEYNTMSENIEWKNTALSHKEIIELLQNARYALMPTRTDAQGVMACEMAAFGIPVITSDIPVCHEVFDGFDNVYYIDNNDKKISLDDYKNKRSQCMKDSRYFEDNTINKEIEIIQN